MKQKDYVKKGALLGKTKKLSLGSHLHFGIRVGEYDDDRAQKGGLPVVNCKNWKSFSDYFIDSEKIDWNPK